MYAEPVTGVEPVSCLLTKEVPSHEGQTGKFYSCDLLSVETKHFNKAMLGAALLLCLVLLHFAGAL